MFDSLLKLGVEVRVFADGLISTIGSEFRLLREPSRGDFLAIAERLRSAGKWWKTNLVILFH